MIVSYPAMEHKKALFLRPDKRDFTAEDSNGTTARKGGHTSLIRRAAHEPFRVYVDGALFYHPQMSKLAITDARIEEDAENIDSMTLSAPFNHPYLSSIRPLASTIVCKKGDAVVFEGRALDNGTDFYNTHTWTCESCLAYLKDSVQPPYGASWAFDL